MSPTWSILAPSDTPLKASKGSIYFKLSKAWLDFFNNNTVPLRSLFRRIKAPLDTLLPVMDEQRKTIGHVNVKLNKPWSDFFNSEDDSGVTPVEPFEMISTSPLTNGVVNVVYLNTIFVDGGTAPYTWALISGALPAGLSLDTSTGEITGTPTTLESTTLEIEVTDADGDTVSGTFTLDIFSCRRVEFEDDFNRAGTSIGLGPNWVVQCSQDPALSDFRLSANRLLISGTISTQAHARAIYPDGLYWNDVGETSFTQFVQAQFIAAGGTARSGLALFLNGTPTSVAAFVVGGAQGYMLQIALDAASVFIINLADNTPVEVASGSICVPVALDLYEFEGVVTPTEVTMRVWQNGTLVGTRVDTTATRVTSAGWPGFASGNQTVNQSWDDFECRRLR